MASGKELCTSRATREDIHGSMLVREGVTDQAVSRSRSDGSNQCLALDMVTNGELAVESEGGGSEAAESRQRAQDMESDEEMLQTFVEAPPDID